MSTREKGLIAWFARNPVAANLLMIFILIGGILTAFTIRKQMFPQFESNWISVSAVYPGAAPQEVEEGITIKVEENLEGIEGIKRLITYSNRGSSQAWIEIEEQFDPQEVLDEIKVQVDSINTFPAGMERPIVRRDKYEQEVMILALYGDMSNYQLKELGNDIKDELQALPNINLVNFNGGLNYEIGIEVSPDKLRAYGLTFRDIASAVQSFSANMSAGQIRSENGYISMRVEKQAYRGSEFAKLPLITLADGAQVYLGDVATINDGFEEGLQYSKYNGKNSLSFEVNASKDQDITDVAKVLKTYMAEKESQLPAGVKLSPIVDLTYYLEGRLDMMVDNMIWGGLLVMLVLALFLPLRLAFWVMMGLPVSFLGAFLFMPIGFLDVTINLASLFAFILVLGIVVDDAIVVGESASAEIEKHGHTLDNVVRGVKRVAMPATFGVLTTIAAFLPQTLATGPGAAFSKAIGGVIILCLIFSLIESKLILPAHIAAMKDRKPNPKNPLHRARKVMDNGLKSFVDNYYTPFVGRCIHYRYTVIVGFMCLLIVSAGMFAGGLVKFVPNPKIPHDFPRIDIEMNLASSEQATLETAKKVEQLILSVDNQLKEQYGKPMIRDLSVSLRGRTQANIMAILVEPDLRPIDTFALSALWREQMPNLPGVKTLTIQDSIMNGGRDDGDVSFKLEGKNAQVLKEVAGKLKTKLQSMEGVGDVNDSMQSATDEVQLDLKPLAYSMGLTLADVASQVSFSYYGLEAQRILREGEEIKVMIRYPEDERNSISDIDSVRIITPTGAEVPLSEVANISLVDGVNRIRRENSKRTVNVWAAVNTDQVEPFAIAQQIRDEYLPSLLKNYPGVQSNVAGRIQEEMDSADEQLRDFALSMIIIFALLAIPLRSYSQPLIIMSVIPFGVVGAMFGHMVLGMTMSSLSMFGIIAVAGVVVNDSLVMVDFVNKARAEGVAIKEAVMQAGARRFRAILLTSVTTFIGVMPIIMETSLQAKIVIPMAVSLAFGVLFATVITLILIPCQYVALEDLKRVIRKFRGKESTSDTKLSNTIMVDKTTPSH
ncbi:MULTISPECIES: efflux RND transporter permease subunit [Pseudoalteromonas]|jgi:multidrug efflux pump subunit AcrB|uniref:Efflux RND transporter permease subunit n=6 Tax=Gammaproteobacteria TaxID=1236 RepID=A0AB39ALU3_9GAMM|nr:MULTISPECIES: efflux RND transporter permease subunit [Pseudoalteromonas]KYL31076.1 acriflavin resistance protein [Pseudoalteromonas spiralis]MDN3393728.1 efflux RND transporter permease subunit [Pseudoalteromonas sp. APC 3215]MDN3400580.1 efflux RND transporter permease subunit [Pseudoalteromonas sp. APC 3213]MDN3405261.1 efflux RND transporter permease subunit [Pseudoalteromonas sp. APC 3218]MDN3411313.1 efflux RND transporter permease subunit [Pseudoalteromonas sp. APC 3250]